eukprot:gb/GECG01014275.1/.p1 GENE.gb/GECG01014275.1/~~gb/GECG01014275.1/.p1  ORF type:complete len:266 (+),score=35.87 gb/GECG01014275.1/:1-798(+)
MSSIVVIIVESFMRVQQGSGGASKQEKEEGEEVRRPTGERKKNFPKCYPLVRLYIEDDVPQQNRRLVKLLLFEYLLCLSAMFFNMITELSLLAAGGSSDVGSGTEFGISIAYFFAILIFGWFWFKQLYNGMARDKGYNFICFFIQFSLTLGFLCACIIGFDKSGMVGILSTLDVHKGYSQEGLLVMALITLVLFMVGLALGCFIIWRVHNVYKKRGLEDLVRGEMRDEARKIMTGEDGEALRESLLKDETKRDAFREVAREQQRR